MTKNIQTPAEPVIYIGPTLGGGVLMRNMVFSGGLPPHIEAMCEKSAALRALFVPVSELATARKRVATRGDILNFYVRKVKTES